MRDEDLSARIASKLNDIYAPADSHTEAAAWTIRTLADRSVTLGVSRRLTNRRMESWHRRLPGVLWPLATLEDALEDLGQALRKPARWNAERLPLVLKEHWNVVLAVGGLLTAVAVYTISLGYQHYYDALGVDPQAVGIGPADILARSALGTVMGTTVATFFLTVVAAPWVAAVLPLIQRKEDRRRNGRTRAVAVPHCSAEEGCLFASALVAGAAVFRLMMELALPTPDRLRVGLDIAYVCIPLALIVGVSWPRAAVDFLAGGERRQLPRIRVAAVRVDLPIVLTVAASIAVPLAVWLIAVSGARGGAAAADVRAGRAVNTPAIVGAPLLDVHARPVHVHWKTRQNRPGKLDLRGCLLQLGRDGNATLIYHVARAAHVTPQNLNHPPKITGRRLLRIPQDDALVVVEPNDQCLPADKL